MPRVTCLSESTIAGFVERCLSRDQRARVELHVDGCASCRRLLTELCAALPLSSTRADVHTTYPVRVAGPGHALASGAIVGRFVVIQQIGRGGMGAVYIAYDPELDRNVALKLLHPDAQRADGARGGLLAEAQMTARISHANVIAIYDVGMHGDQVFAAMELVEGTTLRRWMTERPRPWWEVVDVLLLAGEGLAAAHAAGIVHRDFKPENVLLGSDGRVKVTDFGLAIHPAAREAHVAGTPGYLPVEALAHRTVDHRGDQFSFCVTLYEALYGRRPFSARTRDELIAETRRGLAHDRRSRAAPRQLHRVLRRGLALEPDDRYPSMHQLLAEIRRAAARRPARRGRRFTGPAAALLVLLVGTVAHRVNIGALAGARPCAGGEHQLAGIWDATRRDAVRSAFHRVAGRSGAAAFDRVSGLLDRYAAEWVSVRIDACEATEVRREQPAALRDLRLACLDRSRIQLRALADALLAVDATTVREASAGAAALPALDACSDPEALRAIVVPPLGAVARAPLAPPAGELDAPSASSPDASIPHASIPHASIPHASSPDASSPDASSPDASIPDASIPQVDIDNHTGRPDFRLPFGCGETWQLADRPNHAHADEQVSFSLPGDAAEAGLAVFASAPGWVSGVSPERGDVEIDHGGGWFTSYRHMTDVSVKLRQYVGRGRVIGKVGSVNVAGVLGGPGPAHLGYEQRYQPPAGSAGLELGPQPLQLEGAVVGLGAAGAQLAISTNNCAGGIPGSAAQYDVPMSTRVFSPSRPTIEIMMRRSDDHALFEHWYNNGWNASPLPYTISGRPAVVVFQGELHVIARRSSGALLDINYSPFTGWKTAPLEGSVSGDPDAYVYGWADRLYAVARGSDGFLYRWWTSGGAWTHPVRVGSVAVVGTPAMFSLYDALYIVARGGDGAVWAWTTDRRRGWTESRLAGATRDDPSLGVDPASGLVNLVARGSDDRLYRWQLPARLQASNQVGDAGPELVDAHHAVTGAPTITLYHGAMHVFARGPGHAVNHWWKGWKDEQGKMDTRWHWEMTLGAYTGPPDVFPYRDQLQTVGRGPDGYLHTIWYAPLDGVWNVENHDIPVSD